MKTDPHSLWTSLKSPLIERVGPEEFELWFAPLQVAESPPGVLRLLAPSRIYADYLRDHYHSLLEQVAAAYLGTPITVLVSLSPEGPPEPGLPSPRPALNSRYTFASFIPGPSNQFARAAAKSVAENPGQAYNPLFIYGGSGLGKTHLLHAIGNEILATHPNARVRYVPTEQFVNEFITSIRLRRMAIFRETYRQVDLLLLDDVHTLAGKEGTQEEFFHTFNTLHGQDKQLVISSDRPPKAMVTLEERLRSRFEWGLTVDIQPPDFETRQAILRTKAERSRVSVSPAVIELIARRVQSNIRELEGALTRVLAYADLTSQPVTLELAANAIADLLPRRRTLSADQIIDVVASEMGISRSALLGPDRSKDTAWARQVAMYLIREETESSLPAIGDALGNRDHTTIMYGCKKVADAIERDDAARRQVLAIRGRLYSQVGAPA